MSQTNTPTERFAGVPLALTGAGLAVFITVMALQPVWVLDIIRLLHRFVAARLSAWYVLSASAFVVAALYLAFSRHGLKIIGRPEERPRFSLSTWLTLLLSAGLGLGVLFLGVTDALTRFAAPSTGAAPYGSEAAREAMQTVYLQWGIHMWAIPLVTGLALGWFHFRRDTPIRLSSTLFPLVGFRAERYPGHVVNACVVLGGAVAAASTLGFASLQLSAGVSSLIGLENSPALVLASLLVITAIPMSLVLLKRHRQVQLLRRPATISAGVLMLLLLLIGPGNWILSFFSTTLGDYLTNLPGLALGSGVIAGGHASGEQSLFYWAFWMVWAPFTGVFLVSVSRGRTIRSCVIASLTIPVVGILLVLAISAGAGLYLELERGILVADAIASAPESAMFVILSEFRFSFVLRFVLVLIVGGFGVIMLDSSSWFLSRLSLPADSSMKLFTRVLWLVLTGALAAVMVVSAGMTGFRSLVIVAALPVMPVLLLSLAGLIRALRYEDREKSASVS